MASIAAGAMIAGSLVVVGVGAQMALAGGSAPTATVDQTGAAVLAAESADLTIEVTLGANSQGVLNAGDDISWQIKVTNDGPADSVSAADDPVMVLGLVPVDVTDVAVVAPLPVGWSLTPVGGVMLFILEAGGSLASGAAVPFTMTGKLAASLEEGTQVTHNAMVFNSVTEDPNLGNNADSVTTQPITANTTLAAGIERGVLAPDGEFQPVDPASPVAAGDRIAYRLSVTNTGHADARGPRIEFTVADYLNQLGWQAEAPQTGWTHSYDPAQEVLAFTSGYLLKPGQTASVSVNLGIDANHHDHVQSMVCVDADNNTETKPAVLCAQTSTARADMIVMTDVEPGPWVAGTDVIYTVTVTNDGPSVAEHVRLTDTLLDPALALKSITPTAGLVSGWECPTEPGLSTDSCAFDGGYPAGESTIFTVVANLAANASASLPSDAPLVNIAALGWQDSRGGHSGEDDAEITVTTIADLGVAAAAVDAADNATEVTTAIAGAQIRFRIDVRNHGPSNATAPLTVTDTLPAGAGFVGLAADSAQHWSASVDQANPQLVTFTRLPAGDAGIAVGQTAPAILMDVLLDASLEPTAPPRVPELVSTAMVASGTPEPAVDLNPNTADASLNVTRAVDLAIETSHDASVVRVGDNLPFSLTVKNHGPSVASGIIVTNTLPAGLEPLTRAGDIVNGWQIDVVGVNSDDTREVTASRVDATEQLAVGASMPVLTINALVLAEAYETVTTVAKVTSTEPDTDDSNNMTTDKVTVPPLVTLVTEATTAGELQVGKTGTFTITVRNTGPTADPGPITVTDSLPRGLTFLSSPDAGVTVTGQEVVWTIESGLAVGEQTTFTLVVNVGQGAYPEVTNQVQVGTRSELTPESTTIDTVIAAVQAAAPVVVVVDDPPPATGTDLPPVVTDDPAVVVEDPLPVTGTDLAAFGGLAALMLLLGGAAFMLARRRREELSVRTDE